MLNSNMTLKDLFKFQNLNKTNNKLTCQCGSTFQRTFFAKHLTTKKHQFYLEREQQQQQKRMEAEQKKQQSRPRTRNLDKCMKVEKTCLQYFETRIGENVTFPHIGTYKVKDILPKKGKADTALLLEDPKTGKEKTCGIQTKTGKSFNVENWMNPTKFPYIREVRERWKSPETMEILGARLQKYRKQHARAKLVQLGLNIRNQDGGFGEVTDFQQKRDYILGKQFQYDLFFYDSERGEGDEFEVEELVLVDDAFIEKKKLYYDVRPIYTSSGNTQKKTPDIFEGEYQSQLDSINQKK